MWVVITACLDNFEKNDERLVRQDNPDHIKVSHRPCRIPFIIGSRRLYTTANILGQSTTKKICSIISP